MSVAFAVAACTAFLKTHIENYLARLGAVALLGADVVVSTLPPDRIPVGSEERPQLNIFLYHIAPNAALRQVRQAGVSVDLSYLISAYGASDLQHEVLIGCAMDAMRNLAVLDGDAVQNMLTALLEGSQGLVPEIFRRIDFAAQFKHLTITPQFLNIEDSSRLWSAAQARSRPSAAYRISAVSFSERGGAAE